MTAARSSPSSQTHIAGVTLGAENLISLRGQIGVEKPSNKAHSPLPGGFALKRRGNGQDVADTRAYVDGDDLRYLDLGATARTGNLHIRTFQEERDKITLLVPDFRPSMLWGTKRAFRSVAAAETLALRGWQAVEAGGRVGLYAITSNRPIVVPARARTRGMLDVIKGMIQAHQTALHSAASDLTDRDLSHSLALIKRVTPKGAEIFLATGMDSLGDQFEDEIGELARRRHPVIIKINDGTTANLPPGHYPVRTQDGKTIKAQITKGQEANTEEESQQDIPMIQIDAGEPPSAQLGPVGYWNG